VDINAYKYANPHFLLNYFFYSFPSPMPTNKMRKVRLLGKGKDGDATLFEHPTHGLVVVKSTRLGKNDPPNTRYLSNEANVLLSLLKPHYHKNIAEIIGHSFEDMQSLLTLEYCDGGDLAQIIRNNTQNRKSASLNLVRHVQLHLASALVFLHTGAIWDYESARLSREPGNGWNSVIHRDIKPENILLRRTGQKDRSNGARSKNLPDLVLTDFGSASTEHAFKPHYFNTTEWKTQESSSKAMKVIVERQNIKHGYCDPKYGPPEYDDLSRRTLAGDKNATLEPHSSFDMWQFGTVLLELTTNRLPQPGEGKQFNAMYDGLGSSVNQEIKALVAQMPSMRPRNRDLIRLIPRWQRLRDHVGVRGNERGLEGTRTLIGGVEDRQGRENRTYDMVMPGGPGASYPGGRGGFSPGGYDIYYTACGGIRRR
jgi:serine/threonine protein kinase